MEKLTFCRDITHNSLKKDIRRTDHKYEDEKNCKSKRKLRGRYFVWCFYESFKIIQGFYIEFYTKLIGNKLKRLIYCSIHASIISYEKPDLNITQRILNIPSFFF